MSGSDPEYEAISQLASDIRLLRTQCAEHGNSAAGKLLSNSSSIRPKVCNCSWTALTR